MIGVRLGCRHHMPNSISLLLLIAIGLSPATSWSQSVSLQLADSYVEAQELGRRDEKDPLTAEYHRNTLLPQFSARYRAHLRDCQAALPQPDQTPFSFVAASITKARYSGYGVTAARRCTHAFGGDCCSTGSRRRRARRFTFMCTCVSRVSGCRTLGAKPPRQGI